MIAWMGIVFIREEEEGRRRKVRESQQTASFCLSVVAAADGVCAAVAAVVGVLECSQCAHSPPYLSVRILLAAAVRIDWRNG